MTELECYPPVRRAGIDGVSPDWGVNLAFSPLFNHISRRDTAATLPIEMNHDAFGQHDGYGCVRTDWPADCQNDMCS